MVRARFDDLLRSFASGLSRRATLAALASGVFGAGSLALMDDAEAKKKKRKKKRKSPPTVPASPPPPPSLQLAYACSGSEDSVGFGGDGRLAQTFPASRTGSLRQIHFGINKATASTGDYLLQLLTVHSGVPGNSFLDVLATVTIPNEAVPNGDSTLTGTFGGPQLVQGTVYAAAVARTGPGQMIVQRRQADDTCSGEGFFANGAGPFNPALIIEFIVSVLVD